MFFSCQVFISLQNPLDKKLYFQATPYLFFFLFIDHKKNRDSHHEISTVLTQTFLIIKKFYSSNNLI
ncbi:TPA: hypothetical protein MH690_17925 [Klebsiella pneumoniae]|nr:hypothetical protein [Klebsiella pneumoniae]